MNFGTRNLPPLQQSQPPTRLQLGLAASLHPSSTPPLQHSSPPTLQHSNTPALQHSNTPTLQHSNTPTLQHCTRPQSRTRTRTTTRTKPAEALNECYQFSGKQTAMLVPCSAAVRTLN